ncbi:MAG: DUF1905 domain-containing protein [Promicromonosporaceae bacterium]|nr:DUF1905 domain-containing protein [Promicromonosporaceae bacterium]
MQPSFTFTAPAWISAGDDGPVWWFVTVPPDESDALDELPLGKGGFGSIKVSAEVGATKWTTSLFPSDKHKAFILPLKAPVRKAEGIVEGAPITVTVTPLG